VSQAHRSAARQLCVVLLPFVGVLGSCRRAGAAAVAAGLCPFLACPLLLAAGLA